MPGAERERGRKRVKEGREQSVTGEISRVFRKTAFFLHQLADFQMQERKPVFHEKRNLSYRKPVYDMLC